MRRTVLLAVPLAAGVALAAFGPPARAAEPAVTHVDRSLGYRCAMPSGGQPVDVRVTADVPAAGTVGAPVQPSAAAMTVSVAGPALADLTGRRATSAAVVVRFEASITQQGTAATATWSGTRTDPVPVPGGESPVLALDVPSDAAAGGHRCGGRGGSRRGRPDLVLTGYAADGAVTEPPSIEASCVLAPDQDAGLAVVTVSDVDDPGTAAPAPPPGSVVVGPGRVGRPPGPAEPRRRSRRTARPSTRRRTTRPCNGTARTSPATPTSRSCTRRCCSRSAS